MRSDDVTKTKFVKLPKIAKIEPVIAHWRGDISIFMLQ